MITDHRHRLKHNAAWRDSMDEVEVPYLRARIIACLKDLADPDFQHRMWVEERSSRYIENLDEEIHTLYDDSDVAEDPFGQIGVTLRNTREAVAMQALDRVLSPLYDALPYQIDHAALLAMPEWQQVVTAAQTALAELQDHDTTLDGLEPWATTEYPVITVEVERHGTAVTDVDEVRAWFTEFGHVSAERRASDGPKSDSAQAVVEVLRRCSGINPRALLRGRFDPEPSGRTIFRVSYGARIDQESRCPSRLWNRPFTAGLPEEFAQASLDGLSVDDYSWPSAILRIDGAGFDEVGSSTVIFKQAATALAAIISARLHDGDVEAALRDVVSSW